MQKINISNDSQDAHNSLIDFFIKKIPKLRLFFVLATFILLFLVPFIGDVAFKIAVLFSFLTNLLFLIFDLRKSLVDAINRLIKEIDCLKLRLEYRDTYPTISDAFSDLKTAIDSRHLKIDKAELIQHSSERIHTLVEILIEKDVNIELFIQAYSTAGKICGSKIVNRINLRAEQYEGELKNYKGNFNLFFYESPASLDAIRLTTSSGEIILFLGWYTYAHEGNTNDKTDIISGGNNPCVRVDTTSPNFHHFNKLFDNQSNKFKSQGEIKLQKENGTIKNNLNSLNELI
jgi:hypothetical protein